ncbi:hypothetical protein [Methylobacterium radiotolerans]|uniref:hypothetical protein n=1 Tax=Methylobacterium radiotolerans TaxID=31998 RepID=UPI0015F5CCA8|nr:hypothetical protein [Methylobacterium radiotolerans]
MLPHKCNAAPEGCGAKIPAILIGCILLVGEPAKHAIAAPDRPATSSVNDSKVVRWIAAGFAAKTNYPGDKADSDILNNAQALKIVQESWQRLQSCRNAGRSLDLNLAAAEHYLFARSIASEEGDTNMRSWPQKYAEWKKFLENKGYSQLLRTTSEPVSPLNDNVTRWGNQGIEAGLSDYKARENKDPTSKIGDWTIIFGAAYAIATRYLPSDKNCIVSIKE